MKSLCVHFEIILSSLLSFTSAPPPTLSFSEKHFSPLYLFHKMGMVNHQCNISVIHPQKRNLMCTVEPNPLGWKLVKSCRIAFDTNNRQHIVHHCVRQGLPIWWLLFACIGMRTVVITIQQKREERSVTEKVEVIDSNSIQWYWWLLFIACLLVSKNHTTCFTRTKCSISINLWLQLRTTAVSPLPHNK